MNKNPNHKSQDRTRQEEKRSQACDKKVNPNPCCPVLTIRFFECKKNQPVSDPFQNSWHRWYFWFWIWPSCRPIQKLPTWPFEFKSMDLSRNNFLLTKKAKRIKYLWISRNRLDTDQLKSWQCITKPKDLHSPYTRIPRIVFLWWILFLSYRQQCTMATTTTI